MAHRIIREHAIALPQEASSAKPYALAAGLIPRKGVKSVQSAKARKIARAAFRAKRNR